MTRPTQDTAAEPEPTREVAGGKDERGAGAPAVLIQIIRAPNAGYGNGMTGIRLIVDGEIVDTGEYGGEPEDNSEYRDYKWVKGMLALLATKLGAAATIENVEVDAPSSREAVNAYYAAMAAPAPGAKP